jgi:hypothetical protein
MNQLINSLFDSTEVRSLHGARLQVHREQAFPRQRRQCRSEYLTQIFTTDVLLKTINKEKCIENVYNYKLDIFYIMYF